MSRRFFYNLLAALPLTLTLAFALSLWQSGGAILFGNDSSYSNSNSYFSLSRWILPAEAQVPCVAPTANPPAPADGTGALYYNSCLGKFRIYTAPVGGTPAWRDLGLWELSSDSTKLYPDNYATVNVGIGTNNPTTRLEVAGQVRLNPSALASFAGRDAIIVNVSTAVLPGTTVANNMATLVAENVSQFGLYSKSRAGWADLQIAKLTANKICLPDESSPLNNCKTDWTQVSGASSLWNYATSGDPRSDIQNKNREDPSNPDPQAGGNVEITRYLYVDGAAVIRSTATTTATWKSDYGPIPPNPSTTDLACSGANCAMNGMYVTPNGSLKVVVGPGGVAMKSTAAGTWERVAQYSSARGNFTSIWAQDADTMYAIDPNQAKGLSRWTTFGGPTWVLLTSSNTYATTQPFSKVWGFHGTTWDRLVYFTGYSSLRRYDPANSTPYGIVSGVGVTNTILIAGTSSGKLYLANNSTSLGDLTTNPRLGQHQITGDGTDGTTIHETSISGGGSSSLQFAIDPQALAADYDLDCATCVVLAGAQNPQVTGTRTNILIGNGGDQIGGWSANPLVVAGGISYNNSSVIWYDAWVGEKGQSIILSGTDSRRPAGDRNIVLITKNGTAKWDLSRPDDEVSSCSGTCNPYVVAGGRGNFYAAQYYNRIFYKGSGLPGGTLQVSGDISADNNQYGAAYWLRSVNPIGSLDYVCANAGEYVIAVKLSGGSVVDIKCAKL